MSKTAIWLTTILLLIYFIFTSGLVYEVTGSNATDKFIVPYSAALSGERTGLIGVYTKDDVKCAEWLAYKSNQGIPIVVDSNAWLLMKGFITQPSRLMINPPPMDITNVPMFSAFGDSITLGDSASTPDLSYTSLIAKATGLGVNNLGIPDAELADMYFTVYRATVIPSTLSIALLGYNDMKHFGDDKDALTCFERNLYSYVVKLATLTSSLKYGQDASIVYTGIWADGDAGWGNYVKYTNEAGATATFSVTGSIIYIDNIQGRGNTMGVKVEIDGIDRGTFNGSIFKPTIAGKLAGRTLAPYLLRFAGLANTTHTVVLTVTAGKGYMWLNWVAATDGKIKDSPYVYIGNCLPSKGNDSAVASYNAVIANCVKTLAGDGLRVILVDASASINSETDLSLGYPNDFGHRHIADAFLAKITSASIANTYKANNRGGLYYIFLTTWNIEHQELVRGGTSAGMREIINLSRWKLDLYKEAFSSGKAIVYERR
jgi:hypothetical protein